MEYKGPERRITKTKFKDVKGILKRTVNESISIDKQPRRRDDNILKINALVKNDLYRLIGDDGHFVPQKPQNKDALIQDIEAFIVKNYDIAIYGLSTFHLLSKKQKIPSLENIHNTLKSGLTEMQIGVIKMFDNPVFILKPPLITNQEYVDKFDKYRMGKIENELLVTDHIQKFIDQENKDNAQWKIIITEGASSPDVLPGDILTDPCEKRFEWFKERYGSQGINNITMADYLLLQIHALVERRAQALDNLWGGGDTWTMFEIDEDYVLGGHFNHGNRQINLFDMGKNLPEDLGRFRYAVMLNIDMRKNV
jgi:hypothetical protein